MNNHQHNMQRVGIFHEFNYAAGDDNKPVYMTWWHEKCDCGYERYYSKDTKPAQPDKIDKYVELKKPKESSPE